MLNKEETKRIIVRITCNDPNITDEQINETLLEVFSEDKESKEKCCSCKKEKTEVFEEPQEYFKTISTKAIQYKKDNLSSIKNFLGEAFEGITGVTTQLVKF